MGQNYFIVFIINALGALSPNKRHVLRKQKKEKTS
jgi:hypothetical protein